MELSPLQLLPVLLQKLPLLTRETVRHVLGLSETSKYLDLPSHLIITVLRTFLEPTALQSVTETQRLTLQDPGVKGRIWVSNYATPVPPATGVREALFSAIEGLRNPELKDRLPIPDLLPVEAEWVGYNPNPNPTAQPSISEREKYDELAKACTSKTTVLYFHGGAFYLLDPCTYRPTTKKLAKITGGKLFVVRYRLAPVNPFPAALLDALVAYLTLLYPPPDAYHKPVPAEQIVVAGDSAGGNLSLALIQTVLELRRQNRRIFWFGEEREVHLPAGAAVNSPWLDVTLSFPSWAQEKNSFDYLPDSNTQFGTSMPPCKAWPANPPRLEKYALDNYLAHPLVSLVMAQSWKGAPPVYICTGYERLADEDKYLAGKLYQDGVRVVFQEFEGMSHCFAMILTRLPEARRCFQAWSDFMSRAVEDGSSITSGGVIIRAKSLREESLDLSCLSPFKEDEVQKRVLEQITTRQSLVEKSKL